MYLILGGTGHIGSSLARALLSRGEPVTVVTRDPERASRLREEGAAVETADAYDVESLRRVYRCGERLFMLNPPADPASDTQLEERRTVANMVQALAGSPIRKVVAESTFGARPGELLGDLNVLYEMEQELERSGIPVSVNRGAYYMSNWDAALESARTEGLVRAFFPVDLKIPMVAPRDLGDVAARLMSAPVEECETVQVEGPERYSAQDVAAAFASALELPVEAVQIPENEWLTTFQAVGFSRRAAQSYANMTRTLCEGDFPAVDETLHGKTSLHEYVEELVRARSGD